MKTKNKSQSKNKRKVNFLNDRRLRHLFKRIMLLVKIVAVLITVSLFVITYKNLHIISGNLNKILANSGFAIKNVTINGQKYTSSQSIAKILKIKAGMPIYAISLSDYKAKIESLPWVKEAIIERVLPNNIHISVIERRPIALGQKERKLYIIDEDGEIINEKNVTPFLSLPVIIGDGAEIYANSLISMLKDDPELFKKISSIIHISERRWNIRFDNDLEIKLPEENMDIAWKKVIELYKRNELFLPENSVIDLRIPKKIFVEKK